MYSSFFFFKELPIVKTFYVNYTITQSRKTPRIACLRSYVCIIIIGRWSIGKSNPRAWRHPPAAANKRGRKKAGRRQESQFVCSSNLADCRLTGGNLILRDNCRVSLKKSKTLLSACLAPIENQRCITYLFEVCVLFALFFVNFFFFIPFVCDQPEFFKMFSFCFLYVKFFFNFEDSMYMRC